MIAQILVMDLAVSYLPWEIASGWIAKQQMYGGFAVVYAANIGSYSCWSEMGISMEFSYDFDVTFSSATHLVQQNMLASIP